MEASEGSKAEEPKPAPSRLRYGELTPKNYKQLRILNNECLPIKYGDGFYKHILYGERYAKLAYYKDILIGAMSWKIDRASEHTEEKEVERMKKVEEDQARKEKGLEPEEDKKEEEKKQTESKSSKRKKKGKKGGGGASQAKAEQDDNEEKMVYMMTITILNSYRKMGFGRQILKMGEELWKQEGYKSIVLDVQTSNTEAIEFYKKHGFKLVREKPKYYTDIDPPDSYFFVKELV